MKEQIKVEGIQSLFIELEEELNELKQKGEAPEWLNGEGLKLLKTGYLWEGETPRGMWERVARAAALKYKSSSESYLQDIEVEMLEGEPEINLEERFFELMWKGWLGAASPILSNLGTPKGLPISCYSSYIADSRKSIFKTWEEIGWMSSIGGGTAAHISDLRPLGSKIANGGVSNGVVPWIKVLDSIMVAVNQSGFRRGALAAYLDIDHPDFLSFLKIRQPHGDINHQCLNIHHGVTITDDFMQRLKGGDEEAAKRWAKLIETRFNKGEPYIIFIDTVNKDNPDWYKDKDLTVKGSNLCSEICLHTSEEYSLVCCLSSLNLARYDEWKHDRYIVRDSIFFLDAVMEEFIEKAKHIPGIKRAYEFALKSRALGLGVMGYHTLLQSRGYAFESEEARLLNEEIFERIDREAWMASQELGFKLGEPEWCRGYGVRNTHVTAVAPTKSNSVIAGGYLEGGSISEGIEPYYNNYYVNDTKGAYFRKNPVLVKLLRARDKDTEEVWSSIKDNSGSVSHLDFLTEDEKDVFKTAHEINQMEIINQAGTRQLYIDQSQSLNLFFLNRDDDEYINFINAVHVQAWKKGVKSLYYQKGKAELSSKSNIYFERIEEEQKESIPEFCGLSKEEGCTVCEG